LIIQHVLKGIGDISETDAIAMLNRGIVSNWWRRVDPLPSAQIPKRLTAANLRWHQNRYADPDPDPAYAPYAFGEHTPFISVTAGTVERDAVNYRHLFYPAWEVALRFATDGWRRDGFVFACYVFILGRKSVPHQAFAEELRELNIYTGFSLFQPEGEITAKISIPPVQIKKFDYYDISDVWQAFSTDRLPMPTKTILNPLYQPPADISNVRGYLL
jgi:hypothetical protein